MRLCDENTVITLDNALTVVDADSANLTGATVRITAAFNPDLDTLGFVNQNGITGSYDPHTGTLLLSGTAPVADYQTALRSVTYLNGSNNPTTPAVVTFVASDGIDPSAPASRTINVRRINDVPVNILPGSQTAIQGAPLVFSTGNGNSVQTSDPDDPSGTSLNAITDLAVGHGNLTVATVAGLTVTGNGSGSVRMQGTISQINAGLAGLVYVSDAGYLGDDTVKMDTSDLSNFSEPGNPVVLTDHDEITIRVVLDNRVATTTALAQPAPATVPVGQSVSFVATVSAQDGTHPAAGGVVAFRQGGTTLGTATLDASGTATYTTASLPVGVQTVAAVYDGDAAYRPSPASNQVTVTITSPPDAVTQAATSLTSTTATLNATVNPLGSGTLVHFIYGTDPALLSGTTSTSPQDIGQGTAPVSVSAPVTGLSPATTYYVRASATSSSGTDLGAILLFATAAATLPGTSTNAVVSPTSPQVGLVTITATVQGTAGNTPQGGRVDFRDDATGALLGSEPLAPSGLAVFSTASFGAGAHAVDVVYSGDAANAGSTATIQFTVLKASTTSVLVAAPQSSAFGDPVTLTVTVTPSQGVVAPIAAGGIRVMQGSTQPPILGGTVTFYDGGTPLATRPVDANAQAVLVTTTLAAGHHNLYGIYNGDANYQSSPTGTVSLDVSAVAPVDVAPTVLALRRYGIHWDPTRIVLTFSLPMSAATVEDVSNYVIQAGPRSHNQVVRIVSARYDAATQSVTLTPERRLNLHYRYILIAGAQPPNGLTSAAGIPLDGAGQGTPGTNYVKTFGIESLAIPKPLKLVRSSLPKPGAWRVPLSNRLR